MRLDSHQHFWKYDPSEYPWIEESWPIRRDFLPSDLQPALAASGYAHSIAVQARQTLEETRWLLRLAREHPSIAAVVGWVDLRSEQVEDQLAELAGDPKLAGVRHVVQDEPDDRFLLQPRFVNGLSKLPQFQLTYDLLVFPKQLPAAIELVRRLPSLTFVLDHIAKPAIRTAVLSPWREHIQSLAREPNVFCKVSGLVTEANWQGWKPDDFRPYLDVVFEVFGVQRLMFGSDWPVCLLAGSYQAVHDLVDQYTQQLSASEREGLFGLNAARVYRIP